MTIAYLDHVNIRTGALDRLVRFYCDIIGLTEGPRPDFPFNGSWLYCGDQAAVHLIEVDETPKAETPSLEHFAFMGTDRTAFVGRLEAADYPFKSVFVPGTKIEQIRLQDPDGNRLHVDFTES